MSAPGAGASRRMGQAWCVASILLTTAAQLSLKWAMQHMPLAFDALPALADLSLAHLLLGAGLCGYALSMLCWFLALRSLPLGYAYPMLSISYALVCLLAAFVPGLVETLGPLKIAGVLCILFGVWLMNSGARE